ncbi:hypothetical protein [Pseudaestuariivita rosea]|uniref:hypothetical protein n=1 Tax=Pseudaestuariivita rosea TaxID=2763263 RepID=UPI001ABB9BC6|nr:hypothetical protein [Pseudaestuariivita rosea]
MTGPRPHIQLIDGSDLPAYPISATARLDSHYFLQWNLKRWRASEFRRNVDADVGWYGFNLFCIAQDETPIGTLPCNDQSLAFALNLPLERWLGLLKRDVSPLHNWHKVLCDTGEVRFAHPVVTEVALEALNGKRRNDAKNADDRMRKRLGTIAGHLTKSIPGGQHIAGNDEKINAISDWIDVTYPGGSATLKRIKEALNALSTAS